MKEQPPVVCITLGLAFDVSTSVECGSSTTLNLLEIKAQSKSKVPSFIIIIFFSKQINKSGLQD